MKLTNHLDYNGLRGTNVADPVSQQDIATKAYVDAMAQGYKWKEPVRAATTGNITLSGLQTIDGVALSVNDRVLVKSQSSGAQNGVYIAQSGSWARAADFDASTEVLGASVFVSEGTTLGNSVWVMMTDAPIKIGTTALLFAQTNAGQSYSAGSGISIVGGVIQIDAAVVAKKVAATIGDGSATTITVTHNLNTQDVAVSVYDASSHAGVLCDWVASTVNTVQLTFAVAPAVGQYRALIVG